jgi:hypothetical protein
MIHNSCLYINIESFLGYGGFFVREPNTKMFYTLHVVTLRRGRGERGMVLKELVEVGGRIPVEKFFVSPLNVRAGEVLARRKRISG